MAVDKNGKKLPRGITYRKSEDRYMGRFMYHGESFSVYGKDKKETMKKLEQLKYEVEHKIYFKETDVTVNTWFDTWLKVYKTSSVKAGTLELYALCYHRYIEPKFGNRRLRDIRNDQIQEFYNSMGETYSRNTLELCRAVLNGMYTVAIRNEMLQKNPFSNAVLPKDSRQHSVKALTLSEQKIFLEYAKGSIYYPMYEVALFTGMRSGELRGLQWSDIDFTNNIIHVTHSLLYLNHSYCLGATKTESSVRDIPMLDNVKTILKELRAKRFSNCQQNGIITFRNDEFANLVFTNPSGNPINRDRFKIELNHVVAQIQKEHKDFPHVTPHMFRHTFATRSLETGIPPKVLQTLMGHHSLTTTMETYVHVLPNTKAEEIKKLCSLLS